MNTSVKHKQDRATQLWFSDQKLYVRLEDGQEMPLILNGSSSLEKLRSMT